MTIIKQLEKHFKIRRSASSIMIKENDAEVFTEEQIEEIMQYFVTEAKKDGLENYNLRFLQKAQL